MLDPAQCANSYPGHGGMVEQSRASEVDSVRHDGTGPSKGCWVLGLAVLCADPVHFFQAGKLTHIFRSIGMVYSDPWPLQNLQRSGINIIRTIRG
jgi:hypothetical protein